MSTGSFHSCKQCSRGHVSDGQSFNGACLSAQLCLLCALYLSTLLPFHSFVHSHTHTSIKIASLITGSLLYVYIYTKYSLTHAKIQYTLINACSPSESGCLKKEQMLFFLYSYNIQRVSLLYARRIGNSWYTSW